MRVYSVGVFDRFWLLILPPKNTWVGFFIFNSQFPKFSIPILLFSQECVVHLESGPELSSSSLPNTSAGTYYPATATASIEKHIVYNVNRWLN